MESGWIINFKDGYRIILSEEKYKNSKLNTEDISYEEHWFDIKDAIKRNPTLDIMYS